MWHLEHPVPLHSSKRNEPWRWPCTFQQCIADHHEGSLLHYSGQLETWHDTKNCNKIKDQTNKKPHQTHKRHKETTRTATPENHTIIVNWLDVLWQGHLTVRNRTESTSFCVEQKSSIRTFSLLCLTVELNQQFSDEKSYMSSAIPWAGAERTSTNPSSSKSYSTEICQSIQIFSANKIVTYWKANKQKRNPTVRMKAKLSKHILFS